MADRDSTGDVRSRAGRWLRRGAAAVAALVLLALVGEVLIRAFPGLSPIQRQIDLQRRAVDRSYIADAELGNRSTPSRRESFRTLDFAYVIETDSAGFPNREPPPPSADVVVLGNSLVVGAGVGIEGQFSTLLSGRLGGAPILNLGLAGGSPEHQYRIYRRYVGAPGPQVVIASLWVASDIDNALHFDRWLAGARDRDYFAFRTSYGTGRAAEIGKRRDKGLRQRLRERFGGRSHLMSALNYALDRVRRGDAFPERHSFPNGETVYLSVRAERRLAMGVERPELLGIREVLYAPLLRLRHDVQAAGGRFVVALIPSKEELYAADRFPDVLRTIRDVRSDLDSLGLPVLDLYEPIRERAGDASPFFPRDIHFDTLGNRIAAEVLAEWIEANGALAPPAAPDTTPPPPVIARGAVPAAR